MMRSAYPDIQWFLEETVVEKDTVVALFNISGTHQGEFFGFPASRRQVQSQAMPTGTGLPMVRSWRNVGFQIYSECWCRSEQLLFPAPNSCGDGGVLDTEPDLNGEDPHVHRGRVILSGHVQGQVGDNITIRSPHLEQPNRSKYRAEACRL